MTEITTICRSDELFIHRNQFWQSAWIWNQRPHIVNRRLFAVKTLCSFVTCDNINTPDTISKLKGIRYDDVIKDDFGSSFVQRMSPLRLEELSDEKEILKISSKSFFVVRKLLNKNRNYSEAIEIVVINYSSDEILHLEIVSENDGRSHSPTVSFILQFVDDRIEMRLVPSTNMESKNYEWLQFHLLPKLIKWAKEAEPLDEVNSKGCSSLSCIDTDEYNELYIYLKDKYGKSIVENWPENTDPSKFVYEDIAIATYLCLLWNKDRVTFVDLGCGNGLLVYILNGEGHNGFGIDIRSRKIWSMYQPPTDLKVGTVTPTENSYFPQVDWIIGNHSDELTPWIPLFALRNSYQCKFFLLPCCAYEFSGQKYQRKNSSVSVYNDYVEYVKLLSIDLGFDIKTDKLRIPSTKRICIIGYRRKYPVDDYDRIKQDKIEPIMSQYSSSIETVFKPRESVQKVRNCTQIDRSVTSKIIGIVSKILIDNQMKFREGDSDCDIWLTNYSVSFKDAISRIEGDDLKKLKSECGGLQTLLRNHHSIFLVKGGRIMFRKPTEASNERCDKWKKRPCWFFHNHPYSCPVEEDKCSFMH
ncbi:probable tRNA (uracil-O(2)-)-methyltransferase [Planococcus citri]|uniref:probable tRNA (uracil-O(2)-)-methyltransferase n=1 Tax=Planococcus citri TaxID=170843 RepID=UPI0031F99A32